MKTISKIIIAIILLNAIAILSIYPQSVVSIVKELKTPNNTYILEETKTGYILSNKSNSLYQNTPMPKYMYRDPNQIPKITISKDNLKVIDNLIKTCLKPCFINNIPLLNTVMYINLICDNDTGCLKEVRLIYSKRGGIIPIENFEKLEQNLLTSNIKINFNPNLFHNSKWVGLSIYYELNNIIQEDPPYQHWIRRAF